jgi:hypothetical protein
MREAAQNEAGLESLGKSFLHHRKPVNSDFWMLPAPCA